jgi:hypothetical protein
VLEEKILKPGRVLQVSAISRKQMAAMQILERRDIVLDHAAQPYHLVGVCAQCVSLLVTKSENHAADGEHDDNQDANRRAEEKLEVKKLRAEKPLDFAAKEVAFAPRDIPGFGRSRCGKHIVSKAIFLPLGRADLFSKQDLSSARGRG